MADVVSFRLQRLSHKDRIRMFDQLADLIVVMDMSKDLREESHTSQNCTATIKITAQLNRIAFHSLLIPFSLMIDILQSSFSETRAPPLLPVECPYFGI
ncbi:hypothetical protein LNO81_30325 [Klebsiella variicola subsp. variicola]|nr:hypothetical protein [Klebsiella variicola subsp. variicola]